MGCIFVPDGGVLFSPPTNPGSQTLGKVDLEDIFSGVVSTELGPSLETQRHRGRQDHMDKPFRGRGIASRLFAAQIERARTLGHKVAGLIVDEDKPKAKALYARLGFRHLDKKDFFGHQMKHMVINL